MNQTNQHWLILTIMNHDEHHQQYPASAFTALMCHVSVEHLKFRSLPWGKGELFPSKSALSTKTSDSWLICGAPQLCRKRVSKLSDTKIVQNSLCTQLWLVRASHSKNLPHPNEGWFTLINHEPPIQGFTNKKTMSQYKHPLAKLCWGVTALSLCLLGNYNKLVAVQPRNPCKWTARWNSSSQGDEDPYLLGALPALASGFLALWWQNDSRRPSTESLL